MILLPVSYSKTPFIKDTKVPDKTTQVCVCLSDHRWQNCQSGTRCATGSRTWCRPSWQRPFNIKTCASLAHTATSEWMLLYCLEWACIPVGKMTIPDCGPAVRSIQMKIAAEKSACLSQAKHLLSILMGINGRAGTGDRGVDWLAGPGAHTAAALHTACTAVYSQHKLLRPCLHALHQLMCISMLCVCVCAVRIYISVCSTKHQHVHDASVSIICVCMQLCFSISNMKNTAIVSYVWVCMHDKRVYMSVTT